MLRSLGGWFGQVHGFAEADSLLDVLDDRIKSVNRALHNSCTCLAESDRIVLIGYPPDGHAGRRPIGLSDGHTGMDVLPDFAMSEAKAREGGVLGERLNDVMRDSARQYSWTFVDAHRKAFLGRGICASFSDAPWSMADETRLPRKIDGRWEPYNPPSGRPTRRASAGSARPTTPS
jgi:hypothetical protein